MKTNLVIPFKVSPKLVGLLEWIEFSYQLPQERIHQTVFDFWSTLSDIDPDDFHVICGQLAADLEDQSYPRFVELNHSLRRALQGLYGFYQPHIDRLPIPASELGMRYHGSTDTDLLLIELSGP